MWRSCQDDMGIENWLMCIKALGVFCVSRHWMCLCIKALDLFVYQGIGCVCVSRHLSQNICPADICVFNQFQVLNAKPRQSHSKHFSLGFLPYLHQHACQYDQSNHYHVSICWPTAIVWAAFGLPWFPLSQNNNGADVENLFKEWKWKCSVDIFQNLSCTGEWLQHFEHVAAADNLALFCERHWDCLACSQRFTTVPTRPTFGE